jgi:DNA-binding HxlR family transcriptional regulator
MCADARPVEEGRAGSQVLSLFANSLNTEVLRAHSEGPQRVSKLHERIDWAAQTTLRAAVSTLAEAGALTATDEALYAVEHKLTAAGKEMLFVAEVLEDWLRRAPEGPIPPNSKAARSAVKSLAEGWSSALVPTLASQPYSLSELDDLLPELESPALARQLTKMRSSRQVARPRGEGRTTPYTVTEWLRRAIAPLSAAGRCERRHLKGVTAPITRVEVEAAFLLTLPLVVLPVTANGRCVLAAHTGAEAPPEGRNRGDKLAGVTIEIERGRVVACAANVTDCPASWGLGAPEAWLDAVIDGDREALRFGGSQPRLPLALAKGLHRELFGR